MGSNEDRWEERIDRARRLRAVVAAGGVSELGGKEREIVLEALADWLALDEHHLAEVRQRLPAGDESVGVRAEMPPGPWRWEQVTPTPSRLDPHPEPRGVALVAADGRWVLWVDGGYGTPELADAPNRVDPNRPSRLAEVLASAAELREDLDHAVLEASDVVAAHGQVGPVPKTARDIVTVLAELAET